LKHRHDEKEIRQEAAQKVLIGSLLFLNVLALCGVIVQHGASLIDCINLAGCVMFGAWLNE